MWVYPGCVGYGDGTWIMSCYVAEIVPGGKSSHDGIPMMSMSKDNGRTWSSSGLNCDYCFSTIAYGNGAFVAIPELWQDGTKISITTLPGNDTLYVSTDGGYNWNLISLNNDSVVMSGVSFGVTDKNPDGIFVATGTGL